MSLINPVKSSLSLVLAAYVSVAFLLNACTAPQTQYATEENTGPVDSPEEQASQALLTASSVNPPALTQADIAANDWQELTWLMLTDIEFEDVYYPQYDAYFMVPNFGESVLKLEGIKAYITGYVIPLDQGLYVLSANPFAACFFCGNAGPESIVELQFAGTPPRRYLTDEWLTFQGEFKLNREDVDHLNYILTNVKEYKLVETGLPSLEP